jgi:hypothetical protein
MYLAVRKQTTINGMMRFCYWGIQLSWFIAGIYEPTCFGKGVGNVIAFLCIEPQLYLQSLM